MFKIKIGLLTLKIVLLYKKVISI